MSTKYIEALESLEVLRNLRPGRCELSSVERAARKNAEAAKVLAFVGAKCSPKWTDKQDAVLVALNDVI